MNELMHRFVKMLPTKAFIGDTLIQIIASIVVVNSSSIKKLYFFSVLEFIKCFLDLI